MCFTQYMQTSITFSSSCAIKANLSEGDCEMKTNSPEGDCFINRIQAYSYEEANYQLAVSFWTLQSTQRIRDISNRKVLMNSINKGLQLGLSCLPANEFKPFFSTHLIQSLTDQNIQVTETIFSASDPISKTSSQKQQIKDYKIGLGMYI